MGLGGRRLAGLVASLEVVLIVTHKRGGARHFWSPEDDQVLRDGFDRMSLAELCRKLGRHPNAIGARCAKIGIEAHGRHGADALQQAWFGTV